MASLLSIIQNNPSIVFKEPNKLYYNRFPVKLSFNQRVTIKNFKDPYLIRRGFDSHSIFLLTADSGSRMLDYINSYYSPHLPDFNIENYLTAVEFPLSNTREQQLSDDKIFRNKHFKFQYRVTIKDGLMAKHKPAVKELLKSIDEDILNFRLAKGMLYRLASFSYLYNVYYYCNDLGHITWLKLLDPAFVKKIQEVVREP